MSSDDLLEQLSSPGASSRVEYRLKMAKKRARRRRNRWLLAGLAGVALLGLGAFGYATFGPDAGSDNVTTVTPATLGSASADIDAIRDLLQGIGYGDVMVAEQNGTVVLTGTVPSQADLAAVVVAATSLSGGIPVDNTGMTVAAPASPSVGTDPTRPGPPVGQADSLQRLQVMLNRTVAANPVIFDLGESGIEAWHGPTLDRVAEILLANPGIAVTVVGHTDESGPGDENQTISEERAAAVRDYLVAKGVDPGLIRAEARGEADSTGLRDVGYLERRVEFEVVAASASPLAAKPLTVGVVVPSARNDLAFSQSMVDALDVLDAERGGLTVNITENVVDVEVARQEADRYATEGADVVVLHGSQYRPLVEPLAQAWPNVVFVVGPSEVETDLPNVFVYAMAAEQGAYVLGDLAAELSEAETVAVIGPVPAPEPQRFVEGFRLGAEARGAQVRVAYVGSFNDAEAAKNLAAQEVAAGADVLTGTSQLTVGPIQLAASEGVPWFANQSNQVSLAPEVVVASQVYHLEVALREILAEIDAGAITGGVFPLTLGNGGMLLEFNPAYALTDEQRSRADELLFRITAGSIEVAVEIG